MSKPTFSELIEAIVEKESRYDAEVYSFVREGLDHTLRSLKRGGSSANTHVSGQELLEGLRDYALAEFGPMSKTVLNEWGVHSCQDFGAIVFLLVENNVLGKNDGDSPEDFKDGYDFDEAFVQPFEPRRAKPGRLTQAGTAKSMQ